MRIEKRQKKFAMTYGEKRRGKKGQVEREEGRREINIEEMEKGREEKKAGNKRWGQRKVVEAGIECKSEIEKMK